jgi:hypothetical protein
MLLRRNIFSQLVKSKNSGRCCSTAFRNQLCRDRRSRSSELENTPRTCRWLRPIHAHQDRAASQNAQRDLQHIRYTFKTDNDAITFLNAELNKQMCPLIGELIQLTIAELTVFLYHGNRGRVVLGMD